MNKNAQRPIAELLTGIERFDQITGGGLPKPRTTLRCDGIDVLLVPGRE